MEFLRLISLPFPFLLVLLVLLLFLELLSLLVIEVPELDGFPQIDDPRLYHQIGPGIPVMVELLLVVGSLQSFQRLPVLVRLPTLTKY